MKRHPANGDFCVVADAHAIRAKVLNKSFIHFPDENKLILVA